jgi:ketosteroid isomerase-like protein
MTDRARSSASLWTIDDAIERAVVAGDVKFLRAAYADDFCLQHGDGLVEGKETWLSGIARRPFTIRAVSGVAVEEHGDVAVTSGTLRVVREPPADPTEYSIQYVRVYAKRGGRWRLLSHRTISSSRLVRR